jgi:hypothetical protein
MKETMNAPTPLARLQQTGGAVGQLPDQKIDMFSLRGFELAQRIAKAFATSDAVPAQFRAVTLKKGRGDQGDQWIENPAAMGNCLVAIETARAVGMSITAVMQQANIIEGKLSWSAQFVIAAVNASGRFQPLRFDIKSRGIIKAKYREKLGWNKAKGGFDFEDKMVELDDLVCIAWTLPSDFTTPKGIYTLTQARAADLPIIESSPVSMKLAVEEGWYSKPGSKWQTEMKHQMLQYRSGAFFGRIHAPDIVMGMGQTTEELRDIAPTFDVAADGTVHAVPVSELRAPSPSNAPTPMAEVVERVTPNADPETGEIPPTQATPPAADAKPKPEADGADDAGWGEDTAGAPLPPAQPPAQATAPTGRRTRAATTAPE